MDDDGYCFLTAWEVRWPARSVLRSRSCIVDAAMGVRSNERRRRDEATTEMAKAQIEADLEAALNKTARLREQRLIQDAQDKAAAEGEPKPAQRPFSVEEHHQGG